MKDQDKTKERLIDELAGSRQRNVELETIEVERKKTEEALQESEEKYRELFDSSRDAIMTLAPPSWKFTTGNLATIKLFGARDEEEFVSKEPWEISPERQPDGELSSAKAKRMIEKAMKAGTNFFEWDHMRLNGEVFPATVLLSRIVLEGKPLLQATVRDITERKQAENNLEESEKRFKQLIKNSFDMIVLLDSNGIQHFVSESCEKILGYQSEELINIPVIEKMIHPDDQERAISGLQDIINTGSGNAQYRHRHKSGGWVYLEAFGTNQINNPYINSVVLNVRDITEHKLAEEALKNATEEKELLLKEAHHRVKNNFALVSSLLKMQSAKIKDPDDLEIFKESQNRILIMAKLHEILHQTEIIGKVNMKTYLTKIIDNLCDSYKIDADRIKVKSNIDELELNSKTATSCGLIVNELFTNAYKYGFPRGTKGEININFLHRKKEDEIEISFYNTGAALPKDFDVYRIESMGLRIVVMLTDQLAGTIKVGRKDGTRFAIRFPKP